MSVEEKTTSSCNSHGNTIDRSIGCGCLTTPVLVFVVYEYIYLRLLKDGYGDTLSQSIGFWINVLLVVPFVFIGATLAFEGVFRLIHFLRSRISSPKKKKDHEESNGPTPVDPLD